MLRYLVLTALLLLFMLQFVLNRELSRRTALWPMSKAIALNLTDSSSLSAKKKQPVGGYEVGQGEKTTKKLDQLSALYQHRDKELVFAAMRDSDMSWVEENLGGWYANIYRVDVPPGEANLTVPANKGNEAMVYLTYDCLL